MMRFYTLWALLTRNISWLSRSSLLSSTSVDLTPLHDATWLDLRLDYSSLKEYLDPSTLSTSIKSRPASLSTYAVTRHPATSMHNFSKSITWIYLSVCLQINFQDCESVWLRDGAPAIVAQQHLLTNKTDARILLKYRHLKVLIH